MNSQRLEEDAEVKQAKKKKPDKHTVGLISRLFKGNNHQDEGNLGDLTEFHFNMHDFIKENKKYPFPDYLFMTESILNPAHDFYLMTDCFLMASEEIKGSLIIRKDKLVFRTKSGLGRDNLERLKKMDEELFEKEIDKIEHQQEWEGTIDYLDIAEVKVLIFESIQN